MYICYFTVFKYFWFLGMFPYKFHLLNAIKLVHHTIYSNENFYRWIRLELHLNTYKIRAFEHLIKKKENKKKKTKPNEQKGLLMTNLILHKFRTEQSDEYIMTGQVRMVGCLWKYQKVSFTRAFYVYTYLYSRQEWESNEWK